MPMSQEGLRFWVLLEAEDVLLFRDARPFTAGEDFRAEGLFPPLPPPVVGAIRSALLAPILENRSLSFRDLPGHPELANVRAALGGADTLGEFRSAGPLVCRYAPSQGATIPVLEPLFALPADILPQGVPRLKVVPQTVGLRKALPGIQGTGAMAVLDKALWPAVSENATHEEEPEPVGDWLSSEAMGEYLKGSFHIARTKLDVSVEYQTGLERTQRRTAEPGKLYTAQMHRPHWTRQQALGLLVRLELPSGYPLAKGLTPLGGERRSAFLRPLDDYAPALESAETRHAIAEQIVKDDGRFRLYLATPGVFGHPDRLMSSGLLPNSFPGTLKGIASGKPLPVGGWNMALNAPRPLCRAVPAGTVYFGQLETKTTAAVEALLSAHHFQTTLQLQDGSPEAEHRAHMGFGLTLVGAWTQAKEE